MAILSRSGGQDDEKSSDVAAGAPPAVDFDPNDPEQVKVHYDLSGWGFEQRAELAETLAEREVPHVWEGEELLVPEQIEDAVDALFDELEAELGPFPVPLADDEPSTEFGLDEWPIGDLETLKQSLTEAEIPHTWEVRTLIVAQDAEHIVDDLLDAIEAGEVASLDEDAEAPDGALHDLYRSADRLRRDISHGSSRTTVLELVPNLSPSVPPFGLAVGSWKTIVERAQVLAARFDEGAAADEIEAAASELHLVTRPFV